MSTLRPCLVHQCGTPDCYRSGDIDIAHAVVMEVTTTEKTKMENNRGFRSWNHVSRTNSFVVDLGN